MNRPGETHATQGCHLEEDVPPHWKQVPECETNSQNADQVGYNYFSGTTKLGCALINTSSS